MSQDLLISRSLDRILSPAPKYQLLVLLRNIFSLTLHYSYKWVPVLLKLVINDQLILGINCCCFLLEGKLKHDHCKEDWSAGKYIGCFWRVLLVLERDLRSHVLLCATISLCDILVCGEPKVANFKIEILVNKEVFHLEVSVIDPFLFHVLETLDESIEEEAAFFLTESLLAHYNVKKFSSWAIFRD